MIRSRDGSTLTFAGAPSPNPLKLLYFVGSDSPGGDSPFGFSAVEPYRVVNPAIAMQRHGITTVAVKAHMLPRVSEPGYWDWADVIVWVRALPVSIEILEERRAWCHERGKALVYDIDDYWQLPDGHPSKANYDQIVPRIEAMLPRFDRVICATDALAEKVRPFNANVVVVPNTINPADWVVKAPRRIPGLTVGWQGGGTHYEDTRILGEVWPEIAQRHPQVTFLVAGYCPDYLRGGLPKGRLIGLPYVPLRQFPANVAEIDIACCPLLDSEWSRCKSPIKWMESAILGKAVVASPTVYEDQIQDMSTGYLASSVDQWVYGLSRLIENDRWRNHVGELAKATAIGRFSIDALADRWNEAIRGALEVARNG